jgi:hypothetical protein
MVLGALRQLEQKVQAWLHFYKQMRSKEGMSASNYIFMRPGKELVNLRAHGG